MDSEELKRADRYLLREELARRRRVRKMPPEVRQMEMEQQAHWRENLKRMLHFLPPKLLESAMQEHERLQKMADQAEDRAAKRRRAKSVTKKKRPSRGSAAKPAGRTSRSRKS